MKKIMRRMLAVMCAVLMAGNLSFTGFVSANETAEWEQENAKDRLVEFEDFDYGYGTYEIGEQDHCSGGGEIGSIKNGAVVTFKDVDFTNLKYIDIYSVNIDIVNAIIVIKVDFNRLIFNINFSININKIHITRVLTNGIFKYNFISEVIPMLKNEHINNINVLFFEMFSIFPIILDKFPNK